MKNAVSIHIDIAELVFVVSKIPQDKKADWLDSFVESLVLKNGKNDFAVKLLKDVQEYQRIKGEKASKSAMIRWHKGQDANACERIEPHTVGCEPMRSDANDAKEKNREEKRKTDKKVLNTYTPEFEEFWKAYCRPKDKGSKPDAFKEWQKLTESEQQKAIDSIIPYKNSQSSPEYMKHAERYLKSKAWEGLNTNKEEPQEELEFVGGFNEN
jgi:hypothetical protein